MRKKSKSEFDLDLDSSDNESDSWEWSKEDKRREKLHERNKKKNEEKNKEQVTKDSNNKNSKKSIPVIVCTGQSRSEGDLVFEAAPINVFIARTARTTTKENVEACLAYFTNIKRTAHLVTPEQHRETSHSLSWRVEIPAADLATALRPGSWCTGWAVREFYFPRKNKTRPAAAEWNSPPSPLDGGNTAARPPSS